jgi:hypothetical protein
MPVVIVAVVVAFVASIRFTPAPGGPPPPPAPEAPSPAPDTPRVDQPAPV